jgi:glycosyltransferase involved in cell wall biosynthesis
VRILLATRNGSAHLQAQLDSYLAQDHDNWALWASDDGSTDETWAQLAAFRDAHPNREIRLLRGPQRGAAANFLSLLTHPDLPPGPVALSDQDDVWMPHRLSRGLSFVQGDTPELYGSVTLETDPELRPLPKQRRQLPPPSFRNALVQNIVAGNTITLNGSALAALRASGAPDVPFHDWWIYLRLAGIGARITLDDDPVLYYRQHAGNVIGAHSGPRAGMQRLASLLNGTYRNWVRRNLTALLAKPHGLLPDHAAAARALLETHPRSRAVTLSGAQRSSRAGQTVLRALAATRRV